MTAVRSQAMLQRVGQGFDVHPFDESSDQVLVLGGVPFPGMTPLKGHSDADVIAHACTDAILGAATLGDIGQLFPDTDPTVAGADSLQLLASATTRLVDAGWTVTNVDCTVICDEPKIAPHRDEMQRNLSNVVNAPVSVKGKRTEGVAGLGDGIRCHAIAMIHRITEGDPS